jgi:hypothetical protein
MKRSIGLLSFCVLFASAGPALAQSSGGAFGIGPRVTFQRADDALPDSSALRIFGGQLKLKMSPRTAIEVSADYESHLDERIDQRVKTMPIQASLLMFLSKSKFAPYLLGGVGWYKKSITDAGPTALSSTTQSIREMGYHAGLGAEIRAGRFAIHGDYRYTHLRFGGSGDDTGGASSGGTSMLPSLVPGLSSLQESLKASHDGSMWNWGLTFFF